MAEPCWDAGEMMTVAAARALEEGASVLVGIGLPSTAATLARLTHAPDLVLVYESGPIGARPDTLPLSIGDGILAETADTVVSLPEMFGLYLGGGRIDVGFLGAAQIDARGNLNTTVIGDYADPDVRLPGAGGAPAIAAGCRETIVVARHRRRTFVEQVDFVTTLGHGRDPDHRRRLGLPGSGPTLVVTDLGQLRPDPETGRLRLTALHPGATVEQARDATGWSLDVADPPETVAPPTAEELDALRRLSAGRGAAA